MPQKVQGVSKIASSDLGVIQSLYDKGEFRKVMFRAQKAIKAQPTHVGLHALAGFSAQQLGDAAIADSFLSKAAHLAQREEASLELPLGLTQVGRPALAVPLFVAFLKAAPRHAVALNGLGRALLAMGDVDNAIVVLGDALKYGADQPGYPMDLGEAFEASGQQVLALECYDIAGKLAPNDVQPLLKAAKLMYALGELDGARNLLEAGLSLWPENAALLGNYASVLNALGCKDEALAQWQKVMDVAPAYSIAYCNFANSQKPSRIADFDDRIAAQLRRDPPASDALKFGFAKVAAQEEREEYADAYRNLLAANALRFKETGFDIETEARLFDALKRQFTEQPALEVVAAEEDPTPIFILGMPRSGSSLTETIIGRHSQVVQKGELDYFALMVKQLGLVGSPLDTAQAAKLRQAYLTRLTQTGSGAFITDKMPQNFRLIGHIATALPQARIVHVHRDPKACCWSNFRHFYASNSLGFTNDMDSLIRYFELYQDLMAFWHERFPDRIIDVDYEALVADPDVQIPTLIQSLGLDWQAACLAPEDSANVVRTASQEQVRKKIYKGSADGWRKYEAQAGGWLSRLPDHQPIGG
ncbi:MAG: sulfotransferase [Shimia sp.]|uniref:tetratricopeptide repeat-containing sulfotransferase family protein n=1 Tax=Shimia sp. TaxID=1954381 RepID=UPI003B8CA250